MPLAYLIAGRYATYHELSTVYSYNDALDILEAVYVDHYNAKIIRESQS